MKSVEGKKILTTEQIAILQKLKEILKAEISHDKLSAFVTVTLTKPELGFVSADVMEYLRTENILYGIRLAAINDIITTLNAGPAGKRILVAMGKPLEEGTDGIEKFSFKTALSAGKISDSKIDFRERGLVNNVHDGEEIAVVTPEVEGKPGMYVTGEIVKPRSVKKVRIFKVGNNVECEKRGQIYVFKATANGHARIVFSELQVVTDIIINTDLDFTKGNIDFVGNVEISGSVKSGFKVIAGGDIVIGGDVENESYIQAGGSITIKGLVNTGKGKGGIFASGTIHAHRIVNSSLQAGDNVFIKEELLESSIICYGKFVTSFAKIVGSSIQAVGGVVCQNIGLEKGSATNKIFIGITYSLYERLTAVEKELENVEHELGLITKQISSTEATSKRENFETLSVQEQDKIKRQGQNRSKLTKQLLETKEALVKEQKTIEFRIKINPEAVLECKGCIYPTCLIQIGKEKIIKVTDEKLCKTVLSFV